MVLRKFLRTKPKFKIQEDDMTNFLVENYGSVNAAPIVKKGNIIPEKLKTQVIYRPNGKAKEYADLALNMYKNCKIGCIYCFGPNSTFVNRDFYFSCANPKKDVIAKVEEDAKWLSRFNNVPEIFLSFIGGPLST